MNKLTAWLRPQGAMLNEGGGGPWGGRGSGGEGGGNGGDGGPRNPWTPPPSGGRPRGNRPGPAALDEFLRRGKERLGSGGGMLASGEMGRALSGGGMVFTAIGSVLVALAIARGHRRRRTDTGR